MPRMTSAERYNYQYRRLHYGNIELVPVFNPKIYPFDQDEFRDKWYVPGRKIESTEALVSRATKRGITVHIVEHAGLNVETIRLN